MLILDQSKNEVRESLYPVQWLGLKCFLCGDLGSIQVQSKPDQGTKISHKPRGTAPPPPQKISE